MQKAEAICNRERRFIKDAAEKETKKESFSLGDSAWACFGLRLFRCVVDFSSDGDYC